MSQGESKGARVKLGTEEKGERSGDQEMRLDAKSKRGMGPRRRENFVSHVSAAERFPVGK